MFFQSTVNRTFRYRIYPTDEQAAALDWQLSLCRTLYNAALEQRIITYRKCVSVTYSMQQNELPAVKRDRCGDWYASFSCELSDAEPVSVESAIGVYAGLKALVVTSTGDVIRPQRLMPAYAWKLKHEQRNLSRKQKGSENRKKQKKKIAKIHRKMERARDDCKCQSKI